MGSRTLDTIPALEGQWGRWAVGAQTPGFPPSFYALKCDEFLAVPRLIYPQLTLGRACSLLLHARPYLCQHKGILPQSMQDRI